MEPIRKAMVKEFEGKIALLVDDEAGIRKVATAMLSLIGFTVHTAANLQEGKALVKEHPDAHLLVTDYHLGDGNGGQLIEHLRDALENHQMKVLGISGSAAGEEHHPSLMMKVRDAHNKRFPNMMDFIGKPFKLADLQGKIRMLRP